MTGPTDLFRTLADSFRRNPGTKDTVPGGLWESHAPADPAGTYAVLRIEGEGSEAVSDGRVLMKGTVVVDVWGRGGAGTEVAVRKVAEAFRRANVNNPRAGRLLVWKPLPWESMFDPTPTDNADYCDTGLKYRFLIETRGS